LRAAGIRKPSQKQSWVVPMAGYLSDLVGSGFTFFGLAAVAAGGLALAFAALPETSRRPRLRGDARPRTPVSIRRFPRGGPALRPAAVAVTRRLLGFDRSYAVRPHGP
jgi:hypothetical protein